MTLAEFMRKRTAPTAECPEGRIHKSFKRRYEAAVKNGETDLSLEAWTITAPCIGEVMIAAMYLSRYNDKFYGQWLTG